MRPFEAAPWWLARPTESLRYHVYCRLFAVGMAVHLTLPTPLSDRWLPASLLAWVGALLLAVTGGLAGWLLCAAGLLVPLLWLEDQLTQSVYLLGCALGALACFASREGERERRLAVTFPATVRVLTVAVYATAAFHKLNRDFFDPAVSCASGGMGILAENWTLPWLAPAALDPVWAPLFLAAEVTLAALLVVRPGAALVVGLVMHIPLTVIFAPAFAFTMIPGWVCCLREEELRHLGRRLRRGWKIIVPVGVALGAGSTALYLREHTEIYPLWTLKETLLWIGLVWALAAWWRRPEGVFGWWSAWREGAGGGAARAIPAALLALWIVNASSVYLGLQYHHTGAMLGNLRIDRGCWNHLLVPEAARLRDPYVHVREVDARGDSRIARHVERALRGRLWSRGALYRARERFCAERVAPLRLTAEHGGRTIEVGDLCDRFPFSEPLLPGFRGFQVNLAPECPQRCIH